MGPERAVQPIQIIGAVNLVYTAGTSAVTVETKVSHTSDHIGIVNEVRATRVAEADASGMSVVSEQQGEITHNASVDLVELWISHHANSLVVFFPGSRSGEAFLQALANSREGHFILTTLGGIDIQLVQIGQGAIFARHICFVEHYDTEVTKEEGVGVILRVSVCIAAHVA